MLRPVSPEVPGWELGARRPWVGAPVSIAPPGAGRATGSTTCGLEGTSPPTQDTHPQPCPKTHPSRLSQCPPAPWAWGTCRNMHSLLPGGAETLAVRGHICATYNPCRANLARHKYTQSLSTVTDCCHRVLQLWRSRPRRTVANIRGLTLYQALLWGLYWYKLT